MFVHINTSVSALDLYSFVIILIVRHGTFHELFVASQLVLLTSFPTLLLSNPHHTKEEEEEKSNKIKQNILNFLLF